MISVSTFRADLPEFSDATKYPDSAFAYWYAIATLLLNQQFWGAPSVSPASPSDYTLWDFGVELFVAHNFVLERRAQAEAANGSLPGVFVGPLSGKGVDKTNVSYDVSSGIEPESGHWNLTIYGTRFIRLAKQVGSCPIQVGMGYDPLSGLNSFNAWSGPWPWNLPNPS